MDSPASIDAKAADRLRALLAMPLADAGEIAGAENFDPWSAFDGIVGSYDSEIDALAIRILESVRDRKTFELLESEQSLFVQLFLHILVGHNYFDYGTSPRGAFPTGDVEVLLNAWIAKWRAWYVIQWGEELV